jgi:hypothetical protein
MATVPGSRLIAASSPYTRRGALWKAYDRHYGRDESKPLIWQAATRDMNETVSQEFIDQQIAEDEFVAQAEYLAIFRSDIENFINLDKVRACLGTYQERGHIPGYSYFAFCDPSGGGSGQQSSNWSLIPRQPIYLASTSRRRYSPAPTK